jgi:hypothetical protein
MIVHMPHVAAARRWCNCPFSCSCTCTRKPQRTCFVEHDLAQQHVLEHSHSLGIIQCTELLKGLEEVAVGSLVVALVSVQDAALGVDLQAAAAYSGCVLSTRIALSMPSACRHVTLCSTLHSTRQCTAEVVGNIRLLRTKESSGFTVTVNGQQSSSTPPPQLRL